VDYIILIMHLNEEQGVFCHSRTLACYSVPFIADVRPLAFSQCGHYLR
jgi:hypothetical protein